MITVAVLTLMLLASLAFGVQTVEVAYTPDGEGCPLCSGIAINSPENITYNTNVLTLSVSVRSMFSPQIYTFTLICSIDGCNNATIPVNSTFVPVMATTTYANGTTAKVISILGSYYLIAGCIVLPELSEGSHILTVFAKYERFNNENTNWPKTLLDNSTVEFTVGNTTAFDDASANPPMSSAHTNSSIEHSATDVRMLQPTTWQGQIPWLLVGLLIGGTITAATALIAKQKCKTD
jgi:hypothetical protein